MIQENCPHLSGPLLLLQYLWFLLSNFIQFIHRYNRKWSARISEIKSPPHLNCIATLLWKVWASAFLQKLAFLFNSCNKQDFTVMWFCFLIIPIPNLPIYFLPDDIKLMPFKCVLAGQCICAHEIIKLLCRKKPDFILLDFWPPNSPYLHPVDY